MVPRVVLAAPTSVSQAMRPRTSSHRMASSVLAKVPSAAPPASARTVRVMDSADVFVQCHGTRSARLIVPSRAGHRPSPNRVRARLW